MNQKNITQPIEIIKEYFSSQGFRIGYPHKNILISGNSKGCLTVDINNQKYLVEMSNWKTKPVSLNPIQNFYNYLSSTECKSYAGGLFISQKGFTETAKFFLNVHNDKEIVLGVLENQKNGINGQKQDIRWLYPLKNNSQATITRAVNVGVFTCKGGVGKTTISAHLGALLHKLGYSVAFIDADPEKHLSRIISDTHSIPCYQPDEVNLLELKRNHEFIIYDFPPSLSERFTKHIAELIDFCIVPVVLSPLSMGTDGEIIKRTFNQIYEINPRCKLLTLINNEMDPHHPTSKKLKREFQHTVKRYTKAHLIPISIRHSKHLYFWSQDNTFKGIGKQSYAHQDFLALVDYLTKIIRVKK